MLVPSEDRGRLPLLLGNFHRDDLRGKVAIQRGPFGVVVAAEGHLVDLFARETVNLRDQLCRDPHDVGLAAEELHHTALLHRPLFQPGQEVRARMETVDDFVDKNLVLKAASPAGSGNGIGDSRHVLHSARENDIGHSGLNHRHPGEDGLHPGDADPVHGHGRDRFGYSRHQRGDPGDVQRVRRLHAAAETDIVDQHGVDSGTLDRLLHDDAAEGSAVEVAKRAAKGADGGPAGRYDNAILHDVSS